MTAAGFDSTRWYNALGATVEAANAAMRELAKCHQDLDEGISLQDRLQGVWLPIANALFDNVRQDLEQNWPDEFRLADELGSDFVGQTVEGKIVSWGEDHGAWREFKIHQ